MVNSLGNQGYCTSKSVFRVLGVIGHFYNDVKEVSFSLFVSLFNHPSFCNYQAQTVSSPTGESTRSKGAVRKNHHIESCVIMRGRLAIAVWLWVSNVMAAFFTKLQVCYIYTGLKSCCQIETNKYMFSNILSICWAHGCQNQHEYYHDTSKSQAVQLGKTNRTQE